MCPKLCAVWDQTEEHSRPKNDCNIKIWGVRFFSDGVTATAPSRDLTDNKKKKREGSSRGESKRKLLKETQNQGKETRKRKRIQEEYWVEGAQDGRRRRKPGLHRFSLYLNEMRSLQSRSAVQDTRIADNTNWLAVQGSKTCDCWCLRRQPQLQTCRPTMYLCICYYSPLIGI